MVEISHQVIEKLRTWNLKRENSELDRNFVLTLLLVLVSKDDICHSAISTEVLDFITGMRKYSEKYESLYTLHSFQKKFIHRRFDVDSHSRRYTNFSRSQICYGLL